MVVQVTPASASAPQASTACAALPASWPQSPQSPPREPRSVLTRDEFLVNDWYAGANRHHPNHMQTADARIEPRALLQMTAE